MRRRFTLIEILVVVGIILILSGITVVGIREMQYRAKVALTKAEVRRIEIAISQYESNYGRLPDDLTGYSSRALIEALKGDDKANPPKPALYDFAKDRIVNNEFLSLFHKPFTIGRMPPKRIRAAR